MHCHVCGTALPEGAAFCQSCGTRVPPATPPQDAPVDAGAATGPDAPGQEDLSQTRELPRVAPVPPSAVPQEPDWHDEQSAAAPAAPAAAGAAAPAPQPAPQTDAGPRPARSNLVAMIAAFTVLAVIGVFALTRIFGGGGSDEQADSASSAPQTSQPASPDPSQKSAEPSPSEPSTAAPSPSASESATAGSPSPSETGAAIPAEARRCFKSGSDAVATAYAGNDRTSCEFAVAVREAYRRAGTPGDRTTIRAYSPVTKKWYTLDCNGGDPVRCETPTSAVILLAP